MVTEVTTRNVEPPPPRKAKKSDGFCVGDAVTNSLEARTIGIEST